MEDPHKYWNVAESQYLCGSFVCVDDS